MNSMPCATCSVLMAFSVVMLNVNAREIGDRFMENDSECMITDKWTDSDSNSEVTTQYCCNAGETLLGPGACINNAVNDLFRESLNFVSGLGIPGFHGGGGSVRPPGTPDKPTKELCGWLQNRCATAASGTAATCESDMLSLAKELVDRPPISESGEPQIPGTCFGEVDRILDALDPPGIQKCTEAVLLNPNRHIHETCLVAFKRVAVRNCITGLPGEIRTEAANLNFKIDLGGYGEMGLGLSDSVSIASAPAEGDRTYCAGVARAHGKQCTAGHSACNAKAQGVSPLQVARDLDGEINELIARVDRARLGLADSATAPRTRGTFRPLGRNTNTENKVRYMTRMKFLADWSGFIERHGVTKQQQIKIQLALEGAQTSFQSSEMRLAGLVANYLIPVPSKGKRGHTADYLELLRYTAPNLRFREYDRRMKAAEKTFRKALVDGLGHRRADLFEESVWTNIHDFGFASPMNPREDVAKLTVER